MRLPRWLGFIERLYRRGHRLSDPLTLPGSDWSGFTLTGNRNRSSIFALAAFSDGKPASTFPENALAPASPLQPHAQQGHIGLVVVSREIRGQPFAPQLALELPFPAQLVGERGRGRIAVILADAADVIVTVADEFQGRVEPDAEGVIDLDAELVGEYAGDARERRFVSDRGRVELDGGERARHPGERAVDGRSF